MPPSYDTPPHALVLKWFPDGSVRQSALQDLGKGSPACTNTADVGSAGHVRTSHHPSVFRLRAAGRHSPIRLAARTAPAAPALRLLLTLMGLRLRAKTDDERRLEALEKAERQRVKQQKSEQKKAQKQLQAAEKEAQKRLKAVEKEARQREKSAQKEARELARRAEKELAALEKQARKAAGRMRAAEKRARKDEKRERKAREREARKAQKQQRRASGPAPPKFAKKSHCHACARAFTATRRRHHCRLCRSSCCLACMAATRHPLPVYNQKRPQKVCVVCDVLHFEQGEVDQAPPPSEARGAAPTPPADAAAAASSSEQLAAPIVALAVHRSTRRPNSAPLPSTTPQAAPVARPPTSAPVVRIRKPKTRAQSSKWLGGLLRRKSSATLRSWGASAPVGRHLLDVHLAKTAELLAQASSRAIELREQPELAVAV